MQWFLKNLITWFWFKTIFALKFPLRWWLFLIKETIDHWISTRSHFVDQVNLQYRNGVIYDRVQFNTIVIERVSVFRVVLEWYHWEHFKMIC